MKWIGALLLISTTTWAGLEWSKKLDKRPKHIRQLINALQILEAEILYSQLPLKDAFKLMARQLPAPVCSFFNRLAMQLSKIDAELEVAWEDSVKELMLISSLGENDKEILLQFGRTLGQHDFTQQQKQIHLTITHLERELEDARDNQFKYSKMVKTLGFLAGLFIIILLF
ncbi:MULTISPECIES: stage III sporulation protein SpoIIIAB [unclassified Virgibacillus]|uniref:stage III sporulation protein SpoIIIAB n=1 Tax=unclassified Virgibacillus TaxID=2620237 RepID=UPI0024DECF5D|nr:stage III sporulation protein SpoIIIAB [Virgibacillus sp. LDC-1]